MRLVSTLLMLAAVVTIHADIINLPGTGEGNAITEILELGSGIPGAAQDTIIAQNSSVYNLDLVGLSVDGGSGSVTWTVDINGQQADLTIDTPHQVDDLVIEIFDGFITTSPSLYTQIQYKAYQSIPEPVTAVQIVLGGLGLVVIRRKMHR